jgi:hypothetical protein
VPPASTTGEPTPPNIGEPIALEIVVVNATDNTAADTEAPIDTMAPTPVFGESSFANDTVAPVDTIAPNGTDTEAPVDTAAPMDTAAPLNSDTEAPLDTIAPTPIFGQSGGSDTEAPLDSTIPTVAPVPTEESNEAPTPFTTFPPIGLEPSDAAAIQTASGTSRIIVQISASSVLALVGLLCLW